MSDINLESDQHRGYAEKLKKYCLMDDVFFRAFIRDNKPAAELIFEIILQKKKVEVTDMETQRDMKNLKGRSAAFDFYGKVDGKPANLEIENSVEGADFHRARYHSSLLDSDSLEPTQDFTELPDTYVVFVTATDVIGRGRPFYMIERFIKDLDEYVNDGSHIIYVNGKYRADDDIGWLMYDFNCPDPEKMHFPLLKKRARFLKETEKGVAIMYKDMDELEREGYNRSKKETAERMIRKGQLSDADIADYSGLTLSQVKALREEMKTAVMA